MSTSTHAANPNRGLAASPPPETLSHLVKRRSDLVSFCVLLGHCGLVFAPIYVAVATSNPLIVFGCFLWFGLIQNSLANLMHEAAHRLVFQERTGSDWLGHFVLAPFFLASFELYRRRHWVHHNHVGDENDTKTTYKVRFNRLSDFFLFTLRCLAGVEAAKRFLNTQTPNQFVTPLTPREKTAALLKVALFHFLFLASLIVVAIHVRNGFSFVPIVGDLLRGYLLVYLYGMMSLTILLSSLRAMAEHQPIAAQEPRVGQAVMRNMRPTTLSRLLLGSHGFCEHATHHQYPNVPYYRLKAATGLVSEQNPQFGYGKSYWRVIWSIIYKS